jgi:hypothetical protein
VGCTLKWCVWQKALRELSLDSTLSTKDEVWLTLLLDRKMLTKTQGNLLPFIGFILGNIWQMHWRCVIDGDRWSSEACLTSIRNQRYGQLAAQFQPSKAEDNSERLVHMRTTYTENVKEYDPSFVPLSFLLGSSERCFAIPQKSAAQVSIIRTSAHVPMIRTKYPVSLLEHFH